MTSFRGMAHPAAKLTDDQVRRVKRARVERHKLQKKLKALSATNLALELGVSESLICKIWAGENWPHIKEEK